MPPPPCLATHHHTHCLICTMVHWTSSLLSHHQRWRRVDDDSSGGELLEWPGQRRNAVPTPAAQACAQCRLTGRFLSMRSSCTAATGTAASQWRPATRKLNHYVKQVSVAGWSLDAAVRGIAWPTANGVQTFPRLWVYLTHLLLGQSIMSIASPDNRKTIIPEEL